MDRRQRRSANADLNGFSSPELFCRSLLSLPRQRPPVSSAGRTSLEMFMRLHSGRRARTKHSMAAPKTMAVFGSPKTMGIFVERKDKTTAPKKRRLDYGIAARNRQVLNTGPNTTLQAMATEFERVTKGILEQFKGVQENLIASMTSSTTSAKSFRRWIAGSIVLIRVSIASMPG